MASEKIEKLRNEPLKFSLNNDKFFSIYITTEKYIIYFITYFTQLFFYDII